MKVKFDENISTRLVDALRKLDTDESIVLGSVLADYGHGTPDPEWMFKFRDEGGVAIISGDHNILQKPVNLVAYTESGLISVWPPPDWPKLKRFGQASLLIRWWPVIKQQIAASAPGDRWRLPMQWTPTRDAFRPIRDPRLDGPRPP